MSMPATNGVLGAARRRSARTEEWMHAHWLLDAVEEWAGALQGEYWLVRETVAMVKGRIDALLVPVSFKSSVFRRTSGHWTDKAAIVGVEVKASRADFMRGLKEGQFDRYSETLAGLYVATPRSVKTTEVPAHCGHLIVYRPPERTEWSCVCRRQPTYRDVTLDADTMWRLLFYAVAQMRSYTRAAKDRNRKVDERIGDALQRYVFHYINKLRDTAP